MRTKVLIATLWAGSLWTIGYLVAPTLFLQLPDKHLAGTIAGYLFKAEAWLSVTCALALIIIHWWQRTHDQAHLARILLVLPVAMLCCTLAGYFALQPWMAALREAAGPQGISVSGDRAVFGMLHGLSSLFYLTQSILAVVLILKIRQPVAQPSAA